MKAYSHDLRERLLVACLRPKARLQSVASQFQVSVSFLGKLLHRHRTTGSVAALPRRGGPAPRLDAGGRETLRACLTAQPDATLDELRQHLAAVGGPALCRTSCWNAVQALGWDRKKEACTPPSATRRA
jgi:transposase